LLLDEFFTIPGPRRVYEAVWGGAVHPPDFGRKVRSVEGFLVPSVKCDNDTGGPPLYRQGPNTRFHPPMTRTPESSAGQAGQEVQ
jgi:8-oxo-dGTP diphosphatase